MNGQKLLSFRASVVKDINEQLVLKLIQEYNIISSSDLVQITGMRPSTIFNILKELSQKSLVSFYGKGKSTDKGGKRPYLWQLNNDAFYIMGLDIEVGEMTSVILDFSGGIVAKKILKLETGKTLDELAATIIKVVDDLLLENEIEKDKVLGLGVAFAGIVDYQNGIVVMTSVLPEMNFPLLEKLSALPFPVLIENNANAAAIGLKWNGFKKKRNLLVVLVEIDRDVSGLGMGIIIEGELYRGTTFSAGELFPHLPNLREILAAMRTRFKEGEILKNYISSPEVIDIEFLLEAAKQGDKIAELAFSKIGDIVGQTIASSVALLNPETVVITGIAADMEEVLISSVKNAIEMRVLSVTSRALEIVADKYNHYSVAVGAAALIIEDYFKFPVNK